MYLENGRIFLSISSPTIIVKKIRIDYCSESLVIIAQWQRYQCTFPNQLSSLCFHPATAFVSLSQQHGNKPHGL